ncbi:MAG TPA: thiosulfate oxidation carrier protein SoxY [Alphaproteobacteria bacterium]|nr:thiosulfate oxidation carrier protein SoxY [Alphaproteobacteria bacterium]
MQRLRNSVPISRRAILAGMALIAAALAPWRAVAQVSSPPGTHMQVLARLVGGRTAKPGRVRVLLADVVDNGNSAPLTVSVESPMSDKDRCTAIHVVADGNPNPEVFSARFGHSVGKAEVQTRIRLARSQSVIAYAEMSDGTVWSGRAQTVVTVGGCGS